MHVRCPYCSSSFNLSRDYLEMAVAEAEEDQLKHYGVECINCRKLIKVPVKQMKQNLPPEEVEELEEEEG